MAAPAPQIVDRLLGGLADDVPERDLDGRGSAHMDLRAFGVNVPDQPLRDDLDLKRVHAEDQRRELVNGGLDGFTEIVQRAFADSVNAFVSRNFCEKPILPGVPGNIGIDSSDAHRKGIVQRRSTQTAILQYDL